MNEPLFWNPLPAAAAWLSKRTGRELDALALVDTVARMGKQGTPEPTIIKALLPRELKYATLSMPGHSADIEAEPQRLLTAYMAKQFGPLPGDMKYIAEVSPIAAALVVNELLNLLMYGHTDLGVLRHVPMSNRHELVWVMPWGTAHRATLETCGINRADLFALGELLVTPTAPATHADTPPAPAGTAKVWTTKRKEEARAMLNKLRADGVRDFAKRTAESFDVSPARLNVVLGEGKTKEKPKKKASYWPT